MQQATAPIFIFIDLFGGGGGDATGLMEAAIDGKKICRVAICVNHDKVALQTHEYNYPDVKHFKEDVRTVDLSQLKTIIDFNRKLIKKPIPDVKGAPSGTVLQRAGGKSAKTKEFRSNTPAGFAQAFYQAQTDPTWKAQWYHDLRK